MWTEQLSKCFVKRPITENVLFIGSQTDAINDCIHLEKVVEKQRTGTGAIKRQIPLLKPKREINKYYKYTKYNENKLLTERAAISQKVATQQPKLN